MESALVVSWATFVALAPELSSGRSSSFCVRLRLTVPTTKIVDLSEDLRNRPVTVRVAKSPRNRRKFRYSDSDITKEAPARLSE